MNVLNKPFDLRTRPAPETIDSIDSGKLLQRVSENRQPLVIKNFASHWPMVKQAQESTKDVAKHLSTFQTGKNLKLVRLPSETSGRMFYRDDLRGMNFDVSAQPIQQCIDKMLDEQDTARYCVQCVDVKTAFPTLEKYFDNPLLPNISPFIWIGNGIRVAAHFDEADNIAVVAAGNRRFTLFPPEQIHNLYIGPLDYTPAGQAISLVDMHQPDLVKHPKYEEAFNHALSVELEPGDAIFIPTPWWHHVESLSTFNVLVNYWWSNNQTTSQLPFPMLMHGLQALKNMHPQEKHAWQHMIKHYLLEEFGDPAEHIPEQAKGIMGQPNAKISQMIHQWLASQIK
ncbi:cupin-like domain-containing protein [Aliiglaciecola sp. M165]|nr:cupin-like domain-containing protein [Aliiglaciecola sp. M165]